MANEKRLIDANALLPEMERRFCDNCYWHDGKCRECQYAEAVDMMVDALTVDAVPAEQFNALKSLVNGEWVDCKLVQEALGIDFATGLKLFDFSRTAEWNPAPLNGQKITTKFRLKNAVEVVHGHNTYDHDSAFECSVCGWSDWDTLTGDGKYNYCPNCGAKMDGDGNG